MKATKSGAILTAKISLEVSGSAWKALNNDFNISTARATTVKELAETIWKKINPDKPFNYVSDKPFDYDVQKRVPDVEKAKRLLGFEAEISLEDSIDEVIEYFKNEC